MGSKATHGAFRKVSIIKESRVKSAITSILGLEHDKFGASLGLLDCKNKSITDAQFKDLAYAIDEFGWRKGERDEDEELAIQLIALTWEHSSSNQRAMIRGLCVGVLSRLGVGPSVAMLEDELTASGRFSSLESYVSEVAASINQVQNSEVIGGVEYYLTEFQGKVLSTVDRNRMLGVSAPTSAGKSFALYLAILKRALVDHRPIVYIVPTISLMNQVSSDLRNLFGSHKLDSWSVLTTYESFTNRSVFVMTQERALPKDVLGQSESIGMLIVDEVQNLERFNDESDVRSKILFDAITDIYEKSPGASVILSGPRVKSLGLLGSSMFETSFVEVETSKSPVASITYAISSDSNGAVLTQYSCFNRRGTERRVPASSSVPGFGGVRYTQSYLEFISKMLQGLGESARPIIFSPTADQARKTAIGLRGMHASRRCSDGDIVLREELARYVSDSVHPKYDLVNCVKAGIGFHTGKVPPHIRMVSELAYQDGVISSMVCTTTLMQGVNLPANIVIARNPNLFVDKREGRSQRLSSYEFSNLRGRAGRLMKDFVGRTLVLDGGSFDEGEGDLFPDPDKEVNPTYRDFFEKNRDQIYGGLRTPGKEPETSKFLCSQIRQTILRHGVGAGERLRKRGVDIDSSTLREVLSKLSDIDVPKHVLLENRYWDPFDLQNIKDNFDSSGLAPLPVSPWKATVQGLLELLEFQAVVAPYYFNRYLGAGNADRLKTLSISAIDWSRETPLKDILKSAYSSHDESSAIDRRVSDIYRHVVYGIPALLKPISDITDSGHSFLAAVEAGVYSPVTGMLVGKGLYRDTAVAVRRQLMPGLDGDANFIERKGLELVGAGMSELNYWIQRQVEPILGQWMKSI